MRVFRNKKTGKRKELDEKRDEHLILSLEGNPEFQELMNI